MNVVKSLKSQLKHLAETRFGVEIATTHNRPKNLLFQCEPWFTELYQRGLALTDTPEQSRRRERFYNLTQFILHAPNTPGDIAECGCWKGLSSFLICSTLKRCEPGFDGSRYHIFDSFEGLSAPTGGDTLPDGLVSSAGKRLAGNAGAYMAPIEHVRRVLADFPGVRFHPGWIPQSFEGVPEATYQFVHVDLDLYEPTRGAIQYFYPRLVPGGILLDDDYGSIGWPGAKRAIDEFCEEQGLTPLALSTGQAVLRKPSA